MANTLPRDKSPCPYDEGGDICMLDSNEIGPCLCANPVNAQSAGNCNALREALTDARDAIRSLPMDVFDFASNETETVHWPIRDELLAKIDSALDGSLSRSAAEAWRTIKEWLASYQWEEETFSRYRDDVILDGVMTAGERRALHAALAKSQSQEDNAMPRECPACARRAIGCSSPNCPQLISTQEDSRHD